jgi:hypothetical protein
MTRSLVALLLLLQGCSSIPRIVELDEIPAARVAEIDALPEVAREAASSYQDLGQVEGISCRPRSSKEPASWEDAVRRAKFRALEKGANAFTDLECGPPIAGPFLSRITGYVMSTCNETIRCTASAVRK